MTVVGVNGFGRIGRYFTRLSLFDNGVDVAVVNDLADINTLAHLLKYDSVHRGLGLQFTVEGQRIVFENGKEIIFLSEKDPASIPWSKYGVQIVLESTGIFTSRDGASKHLVGGAKKVVISAPAKDEDIPTVVLGVNNEVLEVHDQIYSLYTKRLNRFDREPPILHY